ncbi:MAG: type II secretion system protein GspG [Candidatus Hydrogenedentes bacterium]|nr:type II secretion system protein GspG [Candidatus Hydrogenedentota bacterium]
MRESNGFTLIELMLVMVIIGILAGMVVMNFSGYGESARIKAAHGDILTYSSALDLYALQNNDKYPPALKNLVGGKKNYVKEIKKDPWGSDYVYVTPGKHHKDSYDIFSSGPDRQPGTPDDITNWESEKATAEEK